MTHARPNDVHIAVRITLPDEEPSKVANKSMDIKKKIEDMLKKEKVEYFEVVLESIQKSR
ncbi:MAG: hypothetical protein WB588_11750 [Dehalococcoidia bacterium]|jgi:hypothetical protein